MQSVFNESGLTAMLCDQNREKGNATAHDKYFSMDN